MKENLETLRTHIDALDNQLVTLLNTRAEMALKVGRLKKGQDVYRPAREKQVLEQVYSLNNGPFSSEALTSIYKEIIAACRNLQQPLRVAYLGPEGTYTEEAARWQFGNTSLFISGSSIDEVLRLGESGAADVAVIPVENSSEGVVGRSLDILLETPLQITGEILLPIHHQLLSHAQNMQSITEVVAHPQALAQYRKWLDTHLPHSTRRASSSNSEAARLAADSPKLAAIASVRASNIYNLPILAKNIEDETTNTTRFLVLDTTPTEPTGVDKTSLICSTANRPGALHAVLGILARHNINIIKLESRPAKNKPWKYIFYIDIDSHHQDATITEALQELEVHTKFLKLVGSYPKAKGVK